MNIRFFWLAGLAMLLASCGRSTEPQALPDNSFIRGVNFIGVSVNDLSRSTALYRSAMGLEVISDDRLSVTVNSEKEVLSANTALLRSSNTQLLFMQFNTSLRQTAVPVTGPGIAHVCFQVDGRTQAYQKFLSGGAKHIGAREMQQLNSRNPVEYAYAHDPDGIMVEIEHVDVKKLALPEPPKNQYRIRHVSLGTPDMNRSVAFYAKLLDQAKPRRIGKWWHLQGDKVDAVSGLPDSKLEMAWFQIRNLELELIQYHSHPTERLESDRPIEALGYNMIVFEVSSLQAAEKRVFAAGGEVIGTDTSSFDLPTLFARDPDGNLLGFQQERASHPYSSTQFTDNGT